MSAFLGITPGLPSTADVARTVGFLPLLTPSRHRAAQGGWELPLTKLREKLVKIGAKIVSHGRYVTFQLAEVAVPKELFRKILSLIDDLQRRPAPA